MFECYEDFEKFVSGRILDLRLKRSVSARDMSLSLGFSEGYIANIESASNMPSMKGFYYICEYLKITPVEFFEERNKNPEKLNMLLNDLMFFNDEQLATIGAVVKGIKK